MLRKPRAGAALLHCFAQHAWRAHEPAHFVDQLELLARDYGVSVTMLSDETPTADGERWRRSPDLLDGRRGAGAGHGHVGVECER